MTFSYFNSRPYTEGDLLLAENQSCRAYFNSRPLYRGRRKRQYFNSRPLYRGRHTASTIDCHKSLFQLTPPIQRATLMSINYNTIGNISTHAPYTEGDDRAEACIRKWQSFQLTPPIQRATLFLSRWSHFPTISTHAPYTEGDRKSKADRP